MPVPYVPTDELYDVLQQREVDMTGMGPDPYDEYTGDSLEDFYEYLMTPRHQRQRTQEGAITHYGPSRFASVRPEDAAMADMIMRQMEAGDAREYTQEVRGSDLARRGAADQLMMPEGRGGGSIDISDARTAPPGTAPTWRSAAGCQKHRPRHLDRWMNEGARSLRVEATQNREPQPLRLKERAILVRRQEAQQGPTVKLWKRCNTTSTSMGSKLRVGAGRTTVNCKGNRRNRSG